jgi:hypothetical protein
MSIRQDRLKRKELTQAIDFFAGLQTDNAVRDSDLIQTELNLLELKLYRKLRELEPEPKKSRKKPAISPVKTQE